MASRTRLKTTLTRFAHFTWGRINPHILYLADFLADIEHLLRFVADFPEPETSLASRQLDTFD